MDHDDDPIAKSLGIEPLMGEIVESSMDDNLPSKDVQDIESSVANADELERDYNYARGNMYTVIEKGVDGLEEMIAIAKQSQHPRAFEVIATLMKTISETNKDLVDLSKQKNAPKDDERAAGRPDQVTNNLFVGSTAELQQFIKAQKEKDDQK